MNKLRKAALAALMITAALPVAPLYAQQGCTGIAIEFGARLLNNSTDTASEAVSVDVPAGDYDVTLVSEDRGHVTDAPLPGQTEEQWVLLLDGVEVGASSDIALDEVMVTDTFTVSVAVDAVSAQAVHLQEGFSVNSVDAVSACLEPVSITEESGLVPAVPLEVGPGETLVSVAPVSETIVVVEVEVPAEPVVVTETVVIEVPVEPVAEQPVAEAVSIEVAKLSLTG